MPSTNESETEESHRQPKTSKARELTKKCYDTLFRGKSAVWTALFTGVLCVFTYFLWQVNNAANQLSVATQAASISSIGPAVTKVPNPDGKTLKGYNITFTWINSGNTPTKTAEVQSNIYVGTFSPSKGLDFSQLPQDRIMTVVIPPKSGIQGNPDFVSLEDLEDVQQGKKHIFFWGWTAYHDGFSPAPRLYEYCFNIENVTWTKTDHTDVTGDVQMVNPPCGVHFCFNEECEDYDTRTK